MTKGPGIANLVICHLLSVGVESRAQYHELAETAFSRRRQRILREAGSDGDEQTHRSSVRLSLGLVRHGRGIGTQDAQR